MRLALLAALVLAAALPANAQTVSERLDDLRLATAVRLALVTDPITRPADVEVTARAGRVVLSGDAGDIPDVRRVAEVARDVPGVTSLSGLGADRLLEVSDRGVPPVVIEAGGDDGPADAPPAEPSVHIVVRGDTLFALARRYGTTVEAIERLNGLSSRSIRVGQRLRVR